MPSRSPRPASTRRSIVDLYSRTVTAHIFEGAVRLRPPGAAGRRSSRCTADGLPEVSADFRIWTVRVQPGIYFADDPAFKGQRRELMARDYVYAIKRFADPAQQEPGVGQRRGLGIVGLAALRDAGAEGQDSRSTTTRAIEGLRALDRYTLQFTLDEPRPRFIDSLAGERPLRRAWRARWCEHYGDKIAEHPVGTGPFRLTQWRRSSLIVLERNPDYREVLYDAAARAPTTPRARRSLARFKGRRLPMVDRVEVSHHRGEPAALAVVPERPASTYIDRAARVRQPGHARRQGRAPPRQAGHPRRRALNADATLHLLQHGRPGGRRLHARQGGAAPRHRLAIDVEREIHLVRRGQAIAGAVGRGAAHHRLRPGASRARMSDYDPARAKALLDLYGYVDRDGDGWRELPDGQPLVLEDRDPARPASARQLDELWKKNMDARRHPR